MAVTADMGTVRQKTLDWFYGIDNLIRIEIEMPAKAWDELRAAEPKGNLGYKGPRYDWFETTSVTVSVSVPTSTAPRDSAPSQKFLGVAVRKRSWAGSKDSVKPSLRLHFSKFRKSNEKPIKALIGTKRLVLLNSVQDDLFIRQPLGYALIQNAGAPALRCNLATVRVNNNAAGPLVYVNLEAFKKPFLKNNFHGNAKGNLYKIDLKQDLRDETWSRPKWWGTPTFKGFSDFDNEHDIELLGKIISTRDWDTVRRSVDADAFLRVFALETLLKHWDGFTQQTNNSYTYNDVKKAVEAPAIDDLNFKIIISGIDQILQEDQNVVIGQEALIGRHAGDDPPTRWKLLQTIRDYADGETFSDEFTGGIIDRLATVLRRAGTADAPDELVARAARTMKSQIRLVREQARVLVG